MCNYRVYQITPAYFTYTPLWMLIYSSLTISHATDPCLLSPMPLTHLWNDFTVQGVDARRIRMLTQSNLIYTIFAYSILQPFHYPPLQTL
jgi:hypothetical protein